MLFFSNLPYLLILRHGAAWLMLSWDLMLWDRPMRCSLTAKKNIMAQTPRGNSCSQTSRFWGARFHVSFSGEESQKTEDSLKNHPKPQTAGCSFYLEDGTWKTLRSPKKTGFLLQGFFLGSHFPLDHDQWKILGGSSQDSYVWWKTPWLASPLK